MARAAAAAAPARAPRAKAAPSRTKSGRAAAPAKRASSAGPARHAPRRRSAPTRRAPAPRRVSGGSAAAVALPVPVRVLNAPFTRAARRRTTGVLDALLAGRGWIALVFVLLVGIVFFNVDLLRMNREIAANADRIAVLKRHIARDRLDVAGLASTQRIQESAAQLGLVQPAPGEVRYLRARPRLDAHMAAKRVTAPNLAYVAPPPVDTAPEVPTDPAVTDPADPAVTDPATADPAPADPASTDPVTVDPAVAAPAPTATPAG
jgi:cell division protein FtsL